MPTEEGSQVSGDLAERYLPPVWAFDFHGHRCPFMPLGYRMGLLALDRLGVPRAMDHELYVLCELGSGHPQTCLMDGIQVATGATFGKGTIEKASWGKLAATFWAPGKTAVRLALSAPFLEALGQHAFFTYRKRHVEPSAIPPAVADAAINWTLSQPDDAVFTVREEPAFTRPTETISFRRLVCSACGEAVFERYARLKDGEPLCIPCSGYEP
jgi:formylmethanofuran dehydrogenase subunit E